MAPLGILGQIYVVSTAVGSLFMCFSLFMGRVGPGHGGGHAGGHGGGHAGGHGGGHAGGHAGGHGGGHAGGHGGGHGGHGLARGGNARGAAPNVVAPGHHGSGSGHASNGGGSGGHGGHAGASQGGNLGGSESALAAQQQFNTGQATALSRFHMPAQGEHSIGVRIVEMLNPMMIAVFLTYFGLTGLIAHFSIPALAYFSLVPAFLVGTVSTRILLFVMNWMSARMEISSAALVENCVGLQALVILPITAGRVGEVSYETGSKRYSSPSRANQPDKTFDRGDKVLVVAIRENTMYVEPWTEIYDVNP